MHLAYDGQDRIALTLGSMDEPAGLTPTHHYGVEGRLPWAAEVGKHLPEKETRERW